MSSIIRLKTCCFCRDLASGSRIICFVQTLIGVASFITHTVQRQYAGEEEHRSIQAN